MDEKINEIAEYIKVSMCIKGTVKFIRENTVNMIGVVGKGMIYRCDDEDRGRFYIGWYKEVDSWIEKN